MIRFLIKTLHIQLVLIAALSFLIFSLSGCTKKETGPFRNVLFIVIDTLTADRLGVYGATNSPSPNIDNLAKKSSVFERAYSPAPWTKPAVSSMFTGVMPSVHGVLSIDEILSAEEKTMAEYLKERDFATAGFVSHTLISPTLGYAQGFDSYETVPFKGNVHNVISSAKVTDMAIKWLKNFTAKQDNPFFLFVHYFDPHNNYHHHSEFDRTSWYKGPLKAGMDIRELRNLIPEMTDEDARFLKGLYDEEIAFTDRYIGQLLQTLDDLEISEETMIVLTADHGEEFLEHGAIGHSRTLYDELVRVPLLIRMPKEGKQRRINEAVSTLDLLPTLLDYLSITGDDKFQGQSLKPAILSGMGTKDREIFSEVDFRSSAIKAFKIALIQNEFKLIFDKLDSTFELYDLIRDPKERKNLITIETERLARMSAPIRAYQARFQSENLATPKKRKDIKAHTPEEVEQLKSLGYM